MRQKSSVFNPIEQRLFWRGANRARRCHGRAWEACTAVDACRSALGSKALRAPRDGRAMTRPKTYKRGGHGVTYQLLPETYTAFPEARLDGESETDKLHTSTRPKEVS